MFEFEWKATCFSSLRAKLILAPLDCMPIWIWPSINRYRMFFVQYRTVTHPSIVLTLSGWTSEFPWDLGFAKSHPFQGIPFLSSSTWAPYQILDQSLTQIIFLFFYIRGCWHWPFLAHAFYTVGGYTWQPRVHGPFPVLGSTWRGQFQVPFLPLCVVWFLLKQLPVGL